MQLNQPKSMLIPHCEGMLFHNLFLEHIFQLLSSSDIHQCAENAKNYLEVLLDATQIPILQKQLRRYIRGEVTKQLKEQRLAFFALLIINPIEDQLLIPESTTEALFIKKLIQLTPFHSRVMKNLAQVSKFVLWLAAPQYLPLQMLQHYNKQFCHLFELGDSHLLPTFAVGQLSDAHQRQIVVEAACRMRPNLKDILTTEPTNTDSFEYFYHKALQMQKSGIFLKKGDVPGIREVIPILDRGLSEFIVAHNMKCFVLTCTSGCTITMHGNLKPAPNRLFLHNILALWFSCCGVTYSELLQHAKDLLSVHFEVPELIPNYHEQAIGFPIPPAVDVFLHLPSTALCYFGETDAERAFTRQVLHSFLIDYDATAQQEENPEQSALKQTSDLFQQLRSRSASDVKVYCKFWIYALKTFLEDRRDTVMRVVRNMIQVACKNIQPSVAVMFFHSICSAVGYADFSMVANSEVSSESIILDEILTQYTDLQLTACKSTLQEINFCAEAKFLILSKTDLLNKLLNNATDFAQLNKKGGCAQLTPLNYPQNASAHEHCLELAKVTGAHSVPGSNHELIFEPQPPSFEDNNNFKCEPFFTPMKSQEQAASDTDSSNFLLFSPNELSFDSSRCIFPLNRPITVMAYSLLSLATILKQQQDQPFSLQQVKVMDGPGGVLATSSDKRLTKLRYEWTTCIFIDKRDLNATLLESKKLRIIAVLPSHQLAWKILYQGAPSGSVFLGRGIALRKEATSFQAIFLGSLSTAQILFPEKSENQLVTAQKQLMFCDLLVMAKPLNFGFQQDFLNLLAQLTALVVKEMAQSGHSSRYFNTTNTNSEEVIEQGDSDDDNYGVYHLFKGNDQEEWLSLPQEGTQYVEYYLTHYSIKACYDDFSSTVQRAKVQSVMLSLLDHLESSINQQLGLTSSGSGLSEAEQQVLQPLIDANWEVIREVLFAMRNPMQALCDLVGLPPAQNSFSWPSSVEDLPIIPGSFFSVGNAQSKGSQSNVQVLLGSAPDGFHFVETNKRGTESSLGYILQSNAQQENSSLGQWVEACYMSGLCAEMIEWMLKLVLSNEISLSPIRDFNQHLSQLVLANCMARSYPIGPCKSELEKALELPEVLKPFFERKGNDENQNFGVYICSGHMLPWLQQQLQVPIRVLDRTSMRARGIVAVDQIYSHIVEHFQHNVFIVYIQGFPEIHDSLLKWCAEYTASYPWRFIWFENSDTKNNFSENRDRCNVDFFVAPSVEEIDLLQSSGTLKVGTVKYRSSFQLGKSLDSSLLQDEVHALLEIFCPSDVSQGLNWKNCATHTQFVGCWKYRLMTSWNPSDSNKVRMIFSHPGAGKTVFMKKMLPELKKQLQCECVEYHLDCSSDRLIRDSLTEILTGVFGQPIDGNTHAGRMGILVADEYHMLSTSLKYELFCFLVSHKQNLMGILIGNRAEKEDFDLMKAYLKHSGLKQSEASSGLDHLLHECVLEARLPIIHISSYLHSIAKDRFPTDAKGTAGTATWTKKDAIECQNWWNAAARSLFSDAVLTFRIQNKIFDALVNAGHVPPESALAHILLQKVPYLGEFMALAFSTQVRTLFLRYRKLDFTKINTLVAFAAEQDPDPISLLVRMGLVDYLWRNYHAQGVERPADIDHPKYREGNDENLEPDEFVLPSVPEYLRTLPRVTEMHPIVRLYAWVRFVRYRLEQWVRTKNSTYSDTNPVAAARTLRRLKVIDQIGFPFVLAVKGSPVSLTECQAFSQDGNYSDLVWIRRALQRSMAIDWHRAKLEWSTQFITDVENFVALIQVCPDPRSCVRAVSDDNLCVMLRINNSTVLASKLVLALIDSQENLQQYMRTSNPLYTAAWFLYRHKHSGLPQVQQWFKQFPAFRKGFWMWAAFNAATYRESPDPQDTHEQLLCDLKELTKEYCALAIAEIQRSPNQQSTSQMNKHQRDCCHLWSGEFMKLLPSDFDQAGVLPQEVTFWLAQSQFPPKPSAPLVLRALSATLAGKATVKDLSFLAIRPLFAPITNGVPSFPKLQSLEHALIQGLLNLADNLPLCWQKAILLRSSGPWWQSTASFHLLTNPDYIMKTFGTALRLLPIGKDIMSQGKWSEPANSKFAEMYQQAYRQMHGGFLDPSEISKRLFSLDKERQEKREKEFLQHSMRYLRKFCQNPQILKYYNVLVGPDGLKEMLKTRTLDKYKNPVGSGTDLAKDGAFTGFRILIGQFYQWGHWDNSRWIREFNLANFHKNIVPSLEQKGFRVEIVEDEEEFVEKLQTSWFCVAWVISSAAVEWKHRLKSKYGGHASFDSACNAFAFTCAEFIRKGGGLLLFAENEPFFAHANLVLHRLYGKSNVLSGNVKAEGYIVSDQNANFDFSKGGHISCGENNKNSLIMTGISTFYEGSTVSTVGGPITKHNGIECIQLGDSQLEVVAKGGYPKTNNKAVPLVMVTNDVVHGDRMTGRLLIDCGHTKLFLEDTWTKGATDRYINNATAWLTGIDARLSLNTSVNCPLAPQYQIPLKPLYPIAEPMDPPHALPPPVHVVVVLDVSGSMRSHWPQEKRYAIELSRRFLGDWTRENKVGIVLFDHQVEFTQELTSDMSLIEQLQDPAYFGGTSYLNALQKCDSMLQNSPNRIVIFQTDGSNEHDSEENNVAIKQLTQRWNQNNYCRLIFASLMLPDAARKKAANLLNPFAEVRIDKDISELMNKIDNIYNIVVSAASSAAKKTA